jgi:hypothetical protein
MFQDLFGEQGCGCIALLSLGRGVRERIDKNIAIQHYLSGGHSSPPGMA